MKMLEHKNTMFKSFNNRTPIKNVLEILHRLGQIDRKMCALFL